MAKRAPVDEQPYRPLLDPGVISAALTKTGTATQSPPQPRLDVHASAPKVVEMARPEPPKPQLRPEGGEGERARVNLGEGRPAPQQFVAKFDQEKRLLLTRTEAAALDRLVISLASRLGAQVKVSHVLRGLISLVLNAEADVDRRAGEVPALIRPPNGDAKALQRFEKDIAQILGAAIRDAGPLR